MFMQSDQPQETPFMLGAKNELLSRPSIQHVIIKMRMSSKVMIVMNYRMPILGQKHRPSDQKKFSSRALGMPSTSAYSSLVKP